MSATIVRFTKPPPPDPIYAVIEHHRAAYRAANDGPDDILEHLAEALWSATCKISARGRLHWPASSPSCVTAVSLRQSAPIFFLKCVTDGWLYTLERAMPD
jgi:hypothetical protein